MADALLAPPSLDVASLLEAAVDAARLGAAALKADRAGNSALRGQALHDVKIDGDLRAEEAVLVRLARAGNHPVLAEEGGETGVHSPGRGRWIVDPLDGTFNYLRGIPLCCVSIAFWQGDRPLLGVVYDFERDEMFEGAAGLGARLNGSPIQVSRESDPGRAVLCTGFPAGAEYGTEALMAFVGKVQRFRKVRLLGSAALSLAWVACGRADAYAERDIMIWDVAAGLALVVAAGGRIRVEGGPKADVSADNAHLEPGP